MGSFFAKVYCSSEVNLSSGILFNFKGFSLRVWEEIRDPEYLCEIE